jgi:hypothetical protein
MTQPPVSAARSSVFSSDIKAERVDMGQVGYKGAAEYFKHRHPKPDDPFKRR